MDSQYTIVFLGLSAGVILGLLTGFFWFSKGKKVSDKVQQQINIKERELQKVEGKVSEAKNQIKTAEAEARASSKEIIAEAKLQAGEIEGKLEQQAGRQEEKEKQLDEKVQEIERQRAAVTQKEESVEEQKNRAYQIIYERKFEQELQSTLIELRAEAYVDIKLNS